MDSTLSKWGLPVSLSEGVGKFREVGQQFPSKIEITFTENACRENIGGGGTDSRFWSIYFPAAKKYEKYLLK